MGDLHPPSNRSRQFLKNIRIEKNNHLIYLEVPLCLNERFSNNSKSYNVIKSIFLKKADEMRISKRRKSLLKKGYIKFINEICLLNLIHLNLNQ